MNYVEKMLVNDCKAAIDRSDSQAEIDHKGLRGTLRENVLSGVLRPWLPPYVSLGKGTIIDSQSPHSLEGEDDIIICDEQICPPLKIDHETNNGIYHYNGVVGRIEVKSSLEKGDIRQFVERSQSIARFRVDVRRLGRRKDGAYNYLLAYDSRATEKDEITRLFEVCGEKGVDPCSGLVSVFCVVGKGIYRLGRGRSGRPVWMKSAESTGPEQLARFVAMVGEMTLRAHVARQGRDIDDTLEISLGSLLKDPCWSEVPGPVGA